MSFWLEVGIIMRDMDFRHYFIIMKEEVRKQRILRAFFARWNEGWF